VKSVNFVVAILIVFAFVASNCYCQYDPVAPPDERDAGTPSQVEPGVVYTVVPWEEEDDDAGSYEDGGSEADSGVVADGGSDDSGLDGGVYVDSGSEIDAGVDLVDAGLVEDCVTICHKDKKTKCLPEPALSAHLEHHSDDYLGPCDED